MTPEGQWRSSAYILGLVSIVMSFVMVVQVRHYADDARQEWMSGYDAGWVDGCSHYYDQHGWDAREASCEQQLLGKVVTNSTATKVSS